MKVGYAFVPDDEGLVARATGKELRVSGIFAADQKPVSAGGLTLLYLVWRVIRGLHAGHPRPSETHEPR